MGITNKTGVGLPVGGQWTPKHLIVEVDQLGVNLPQVVRLDAPVGRRIVARNLL